MEHLYDEIPVSIDCHPTSPLIAVGFIDGTISISSYEFSSAKKTSSKSDRKRRSRIDRLSKIDNPINLRLSELHLRKHKAAVRRLQFTPESGDRLIVVTKNRALCQWDVETGKRLRCIRSAHDVSPFALHCPGDDQAATGDEAGVVKLWDWRVDRKSSCVASFEEEHLDIINDLNSCGDKRILLAVSGDATLSALNVKNKKVEMQSEEMHAELLSVAVAKNGEKVVCGSGEGGYVEIFNWNEFGNIFERMQTDHRDSVDRLVDIGESGLVASASSSDGSIRLLRFGPNGDLGLIGQHTEDDIDDCIAGVEDLSITNDRRYLVSCGHDQKVKFWDLDQAMQRLCSAKKGKKGDGDEEPPSKKEKKPTKSRKEKSIIDIGFFEGLHQEEKRNNEVAKGESDSDEDDSDSD